MSTPASELGSVETGSTAAPAAATPPTQTSGEAVPAAQSQGPTSWLQVLLHPISAAEAGIANWGLIAFGAVLVLGALLIGLSAAKKPAVVGALQEGAARAASIGVV